jgi:hypothetical protein
VAKLGSAEDADAFFTDIAERVDQGAFARASSVDTATRIYNDLIPHQKLVVLAIFKFGVRFFSLLVPRRGSKSYLFVAIMVIYGILKPYSIFPFISLTKDSAKRIWWDILKDFDRRYELNLKFNENELSWTFPNGSRGFLHGCMTGEELDKLRGFESDFIAIDEAGTMPPGIIDTLVNKILMPLCMSRRSIMGLGGTPGQFLDGEFFKSSYGAAVNDNSGLPWGRPWEERELAKWAGVATPEEDVAENDNKPQFKWHLFRWSIKDNVAMPHQWHEALRTKRVNGWADDHPEWLSEYLGQWVTRTDSLVYSYGRLKALGRCVWTPDRVNGHPITGLPLNKTWRFLLGVDFGWEDPTAFVIAAYSDNDPCLYYVWDHAEPKMFDFEVVAKIRELEDLYGTFDAIVVDDQGPHKQMVESMNASNPGLNLLPAMKAHKWVFIEQLNGDFHSGRAKLIEDSDLAREMEVLQCDLRGITGDAAKIRKQLAREGKLKELASLPNHRCDAALYLWRHSLHLFGREALEEGVDPFEAARRLDAEAARRAAERRDGAQDGAMELGTEHVLEGDALLSAPLPYYVTQMRRG